jgi:hypothetical protein
MAEDSEPNTGLVFVTNDANEYDSASVSKVHVRQKRRHQKSRYGCTACKQRKVKVTSPMLPARVEYPGFCHAKFNLAVQ